MRQSGLPVCTENLIRRLGKERQQVMPLEAALQALVDEVVPPDVRWASQAA